MASKEVHILIPVICEYGTLQGKGDFVDMIKVKSLRGGEYPGLSGPI